MHTAHACNRKKIGQLTDSFNYSQTSHGEYCSLIKVLTSNELGWNGWSVRLDYVYTKRRFKKT